VFCGYPEIVQSSDSSSEAENLDKLYNSQLVVDPKGNFIKSYKKTFLYEVDETWADEGTGFEFTDIINRNGQSVRVGNGICMDINPKQFKSPFEAYEFANFHKENNCEVIIFSSNWLDPNEYGSDQETTPNDECMMNTLNYWALRAKPFLVQQNSDKSKFFENRWNLSIFEFKEKKNQLFVF